MMTRPRAASKIVRSETRTQKYFLSKSNALPRPTKELRGVLELEGRLVGGIVVDGGCLLRVRLYIR